MDISRLLDRRNRTESLAYLTSLDFKDAPKALANLELIAEGVDALPLPELIPILLRACSSSSDPDDCLNNFERVSAACESRGTLINLVSGHPEVLKVLAPL